MKLTKEVIQELKGKKILIITDRDFTYKGYILDYGEDYINFIDKYNTKRLITLNSIKILEEVNE